MMPNLETKTTNYKFLQGFSGLLLAILGPFVALFILAYFGLGMSFRIPFYVIFPIIDAILFVMFRIKFPHLAKWIAVGGVLAVIFYFFIIEPSLRRPISL